MNTFKKTILSVLALMISFSGWSAEEPSGKKSTETGKAIQRYFKFPSLLQPAHSFEEAKPSRVEVLYTTDRSGRVNFALAKTEDRMLKEEIEKQFYRLSLRNVEENVVHKVVLTFRVI